MGLNSFGLVMCELGDESGNEWHSTVKPKYHANWVLVDGMHGWVGFSHLREGFLISRFHPIAELLKTVGP